MRGQHILITCKHMIGAEACISDQRLARIHRIVSASPVMYTHMQAVCGVDTKESYAVPVPINCGTTPRVPASWF
jgi:hypothetical protein